MTGDQLFFALCGIIVGCALSGGDVAKCLIAVGPLMVWLAFRKPRA